MHLRGPTLLDVILHRVGDQLKLGFVLSMQHSQHSSSPDPQQPPSLVTVLRTSRGWSGGRHTYAPHGAETV
jgi:hypothetical protein